jgi:hypothetical protein
MRAIISPTRSWRRMNPRSTHCHVAIVAINHHENPAIAAVLDPASRLTCYATFSAD